MFLIYDTETTGLINFRKHLLDACQPNLVQLAGTLVNREKIVLGQLNFIIQPDGWTIPKEASDIHGITQEIAEQYGVPIKVALAAFNHLSRSATHGVAHNIGFDKDILTIAYHRQEVPSRMSHLKDICTMKTLGPILKLPPTARMKKYKPKLKWKSPNLQEAHYKIFKENFDNAHNAMADVDACAKLLFHLIETDQLKV